MKLTKLFEPCKVGNIELKNRIIMPPISTDYVKDGFVIDQMKHYYAERAKGGVAMIMVEDAIIDSPVGHHTPNPLRIDDDKFVPGLRDLADVIKEQGAKACLQISHAGRRGIVTLTTGMLQETRKNLPVAPSSIPYPGLGYIVPRELTIEEIDEIIEKFAQAARRAVDAGFDAISLHCTHGYLVSQFLSPLSNQRQDEYGGDLEGRIRFPLRIIERIKEMVGSDYPFLCRIGPEVAEGGLTLDDTQWIARRFQEAGIDAVNVSVSTASGVAAFHGFVTPIAPMRLPRGCMVHFAEAVKKAVSIPVGTANRINDPQLAEEILEAGKADLIAMGRALVADPELPKKAFEGRLDDIRPCIACNECARIVAETHKGMECTVNAAAGKEEEIRLSATKKGRRVLIVGGGPAGMEAARVAAIRGHEVFLYEQNSELGGQLLLAAVPPGKDEIASLTNYLITQVKKLGIKIETGKKVTPETMKNIRPEVMIVATGSKPIIPEIPGINRESVVTAAEVLQGKVETKERVAVLGGGQVGAEVAEYLAQKGRRVTIIEMLAEIVPSLAKPGKELLILSLKDMNVKVLTRTEAEEITDSGVVVVAGRKRRLIEADTVVLAVGAQPENELVEEFKNEVQELYSIGDSSKPGKILDAVQDGFRTAIAI